MPAPAAPKKLRPKALDTLITNIASRYMAGVQIPLLDIPKVYDAGRTAYANTTDMLDVEAAIAKSIASLRVN